MEPIQQYHFIVAAFIARLFLGCLFVFQGYDAVVNVKIKNVINSLDSNFSGSIIPKPLIAFTAWFTSYTELIGGCLLIMGLFTYPALYLLGINLLIAAIGFGIHMPLWDTRHVLPRLLLLLFLLTIPSSWHLFSFDYLLTK